MPGLGQIITQDDGSEVILTTRGWVPNTPELERAAALGSIGAAAESLADSATLGLMPEAARTPGLAEVSPVASMAGPVTDVALAATGAAGLARAGLKRSAGSMSERVAARIQAESGQLVRRPSDMAGSATMGGQALKRLEGAAETIPGVNLPLLAQKAVNQRRVNMAVAKGLGLADDAVQQARLGLTDDLLGEYLLRSRSEFNQVRDSLTGKFSQLDVAPVVDQAVDSKFVTGKLATQIENSKNITGKELMQVRSKLNDVLASNETFLVKEQAHEIIEQIDDIIEAALGSEGRQFYKEVRARHRLWANLRRGRGLSPDGQVNVRTVDGRFKTNYGDNYIAGEIDSLGLPDDVANALKVTREGAGLDVGLPSSGTAERGALMLLGAAGIGVAGAN